MCVVVSYLQYETSEIQTASEQELWYYMCIKKNNKKEKKQKNINTKSLDICCTLNGLFILNFVSIGLLY